MVHGSNLAPPIVILFQPPPTPFKYAFSAGRAPGGKPDRFAEQEGDEYGNIKGSYAYLDPNFQWRQVCFFAPGHFRHPQTMTSNVNTGIMHFARHYQKVL